MKEQAFEEEELSKLEVIFWLTVPFLAVWKAFDIVVYLLK